MKKRCSILMFFLLALMQVISQETAVDTILQLDGLSISAERFKAFSSGQKIRTLQLDTLSDEPGDQLASILRENTSIHIRSYGPGSISSMSFRGTSSAQSGIFWNGINIRMPSLGSTDLSLIPSAFFNTASIVYGGSSMRYGSGTIGGSVFLNNNADFRKATEASLTLGAGSFGELGTTATFRHSGDRYYLSLGVNSRQAENDFTYTNNRGESKTLDNASMNGLGLHAHAALKVSSHNQLKLFIWYQEALREIPPTATMAASEAYQSDRAFRSSLQWKTYFSRGVLNIKTAWFSEYENYTDPLIGLNSEINTGSWFAEAEYRHQLTENGTLNAGVSMKGENADIEAYGGNKTRQGIAAFLNYRQYFPRMKYTLLVGARQEVNENTLTPFTPSAGIEGPLAGFLSQKINLSRNYRLPTMNELFWQPGGNPDIKAEESWNAGYSLIAELWKEHEPATLSITATAFSSFVENWILWQPVNIFWSANNVQEVWARGVEADIDFSYRFQHFRTGAQLSYIWSKSTNEAGNGALNAKGKQLIYTPRHTAGSKILAGIKTWQAVIYGNYTGKTYTTTDNNDEMPAYFLTDLSLKKQFNTKHMKYRLTARVNNIFDIEYQVIAYRPMPGRNYQLSLQLTFKN
ncbi:MAG: TonB-dependent receptor plug domain-containing protein [Bacteroidales bacterium]|nr:TonB-dependent receptor plug domain-containing protein [Bacteroidales bacterium]